MLRERSWFRITAGQKDYSGRMRQMEQSRNEHYAGLGIPPGPPTNKGIWGVAGLPAGWQETTGQALTNGTLGNNDIPDNWPRPPIKNKPGDVPGPPVQYGPPVNPNNVEPGYGFSQPLPLREDDIYFYHTDHLGSTSYVTDSDGGATQFVCYIPFGEAFVDEHTTRPGMPYKFNGKEQDAETGLLYYGARYYDPKECRFYGVDPMAEKHSFESPYVFVHNKPLIYLDPDGRDGILVVFPNFKVDTETRLGKQPLGHAGVLLIDNKTGYTRYYEYGRYRTDDGTKGKVRNVSVSNVVIDKETGKPKQSSLNKVLGQISKASGQNGRIQGAYVEGDFNKMNDYAIEKFYFSKIPLDLLTRHQI